MVNVVSSERRDHGARDNRKRSNRRKNVINALVAIFLVSNLLSLKALVNSTALPTPVASATLALSPSSSPRAKEEKPELPHDKPTVPRGGFPAINRKELESRLREMKPPFDSWLASALPAILDQDRPLGSEVVQIRHCLIHKVDFANFTEWAKDVLHEMESKYKSLIQKKRPEVDDRLTLEQWDGLICKEFTLQMLEMFATHSSLCNFDSYSLEITAPSRLDNAATLLRSVPSHPVLPRFAFVIVAFKDSPHLERIIDALHMPHHLFVVHLEKQTKADYEDQVQKIASKYKNVAVIKFSTVTYRTDSISFINLQIMYWLVHVVKLNYDYHFTMGGAVYPLWGAHELAVHLLAPQNHRDVWLGELVHNGKILDGDEYLQWDYLQRKRFIYTAGMAKWQSRTKLILKRPDLFSPEVPKYIQTNMTKKTNSGNQAVFSFRFVQKLIYSPQVKELFALAKYGCCCCLEERTWITAARMLGFGAEAMDSASVFQVWGGMSQCQSSMNNAVLGTNSSVCYKNEDASLGSAIRKQTHKDGDPIYVRGDELLRELKNAKSRGFMFARKFKSDDASSMALLEQITTELHQTSTD